MEKERKSDTADRELYLTKRVNAPIELVWDIWTKPEHICKWWGPNDFTCTIHKMEMKPGGTWDLTLHGPDGTDYRNKNQFTEIEKYKRIVFEHISAPKHITTVTFASERGQTLITWHMLFESRESFERTVKTFGADKGQKENAERMEAYLSKVQTDIQ